jgi:hypothetical protein
VTRASSGHYASTAVVLLALFAEGQIPVDFRASCQFLRSGLQNGLWDSEDEIVNHKGGLGVHPAVVHFGILLSRHGILCADGCRANARRMYDKVYA